MIKEDMEEDNTSDHTGMKRRIMINLNIGKKTLDQVLAVILSDSEKYPLQLGSLKLHTSDLPRPT